MIHHLRKLPCLGAICKITPRARLISRRQSQSTTNDGRFFCEGHKERIDTINLDFLVNIMQHRSTISGYIEVGWSTLYALQYVVPKVCGSGEYNSSRRVTQSTTIIYSIRHWIFAVHCSELKVPIRILFSLQVQVVRWERLERCIKNTTVENCSELRGICRWIRSHTAQTMCYIYMCLVSSIETLYILNENDNCKKQYVHVCQRSLGVAFMHGQYKGLCTIVVLVYLHVRCSFQIWSA